MMERCDSCGKEFKESELQQVINSDVDEILHVCSDCLAFYSKCDICGMYRPSDQVNFDPDSESHICNLCQEGSMDEAVPDTDGIDMEDESWQD